MTTARNDLGVIFATSEASKQRKNPFYCPCLTDMVDATLEPVSWQEMRCPKTGKIEKRKCAKPLEM